MIHGVIESDGVIFAFVSVPEPCAVMFLFVDGIDDRERSDFSHSFAVYPRFCPPYHLQTVTPQPQR